MYRSILIASIGFGSGHNRAAEAISESLALQFPDAEIKIVDFLDFEKNLWDRLSIGIYFTAIKFFPQAYHFFYKIFSNLSWLHPILFLPYKKKMHWFLKSSRAELIVSTHVFCAWASCELKREGFNIKATWGILTDFIDDAYWNTCRLDRLFVPTEELKEKLIKNGIDESSITVAQMPVSSRFYQKKDRYAICKKIDPNLKSNLFTILVLGGGNGLGNIEEIVKGLLDMRVQILVVAGINNSLRERLEGLRQRYSNIFVFGYIDNIHELMDISDICLTKPGGMTIAECMAKGLPMIIYGRPIPGPETENIAFLSKKNMAKKCETIKELQDILLAKFNPDLTLI